MPEPIRDQMWVKHPVHNSPPDFSRARLHYCLQPSQACARYANLTANNSALRIRKRNLTG